MKALVTKVSDWDYEEIMEFKTLKELLKFCDENGSIILKEDYCPGCNTEYTLKICDDYEE